MTARYNSCLYVVTRFFIFNKIHKIGLIDENCNLGFGREWQRSGVKTSNTLFELMMIQNLILYIKI